MPAVTARHACSVAALTLIVTSGCMIARHPAPVTDRTRSAPVPATAPAVAKPVAAPPVRETDPRPELYTVKKGDTLYLIALDHGLDYKELAAWNNLDNPNVIYIGQQLRMRAPATGAVTSPLKPVPAVEARPIGNATAPVTTNEAIKSQPKAVKVPYSD
jgi:lipoprotein NlpD